MNMKTHFTKVQILKLKYLLISIFTYILLSMQIVANDKLEKVSIQLQWLDQFQFAGYYMAKEKAFYKDVGLDVEIKKYDYGINPVDEVLSKRATYGVGRSSLIIEKSKGKNIFILASIFQSSPLVLLARKDSGIKTIKDFVGKKVMVTNDAKNTASLHAMMLKTSINPDKVNIQEHSFKLEDLINKKTDLMASYISNEPYQLEKKGIQYTIFDPKDYGFDFYSDILFSHGDEKTYHSNRAINFKRATLRGWQYAFNNIEETVELILKKYNIQNKTKEALVYEALELKKLAYYQSEYLGQIKAEKIQRIYDIYAVMGLTKNIIDLDDFIMNGTTSNKFQLSNKEQLYIKSNPVVNIAMVNDFKPFSYLKHNSHEGLSKDILDKISQMTGLTFDVRLSSWSEAYNSFKNKKSDMISGISYTNKREPFTNFTKPFYHISTYVFGTKDNNSYVDINSLKGKKVGITRDIFYKDDLIKLGIDIKEYDGSIQKVEAIAVGDIDYFLASFTSGREAINKKAITNIKALAELQDIKKEDLRFGVLKDNRVLFSIIEKSLEKILEDEYEKLINKWIMFLPSDDKNFILLTQEEKQYLKQHHTLKVHNEINWAPFNFNENGIAKGYSIDYMNLLASKLGVKVDYISGYSWSEFMEMLQTPDLDLIINISKSKEREKTISFTDVFLSVKNAIYTNVNAKEFNSLEDLEHKTIAMPKGFFAQKFLEKNNPNIKQVLVKDSLEALKLLSLGKVDATIGKKIVLDYTIENNLISNVIATQYIEDDRIVSHIRLGSAKEDKILTGILKKAQKVVTEKEIKELKSKWFAAKMKPETKKYVSLTQEEKQYLKNKKVITYCSDSDWMPFEMIQDGKQIGISSEYVKILAERLNIPFKLIEASSWSETLNRAEKRECDILSFLSMETENRKKNFSFLKPYISTPLVLATKHNVTFITDFDELDNREIGIGKGYAFAEILKNKYPNIIIKEVENPKEGLTKVKKGELFGYVGALATVGYLFQTEFTGELKIAGKFDEKWELGIGLRNDDKILFSILEKAVDSIDEDTNKKIFNKWVAVQYGDKVDYTLIWRVILFSIIIILMIIYWNRKLTLLNHKLELEKEKAQAALKIKSNFLANISHEIRTPMNSIIGIAYLLKKSLESEKQKEQVTHIEIASNSLLRLLNDILDVSKMEEGKITILNDNFNLLTVIKNVNAICNIAAHEKGLRFSIKYDENISKNLHGDSLRLEQVLVNLLINAIKFTHDGEVILTIKESKDNIYTFTIEDTGIGMSSEQLLKVFTPFTQADETTTRQFGGTGLGLSISKQLVELMGGEIFVKSIVDKGTTVYFKIELPKFENKENIHDEISKAMKFNIVHSINDKRTSLRIEDEKELILELIKAITKNRPMLCTPILEELENFKLNTLTDDEFKLIKQNIKRYRFKEAKEVLENYDA